MSAGDQVNDSLSYMVVLNHEEQYSIWPLDREPPDGWRREGKIGVKADCLSYIDKVWVDMKPLSLRRSMNDESQ